jgi:hypothetical protein
LKRSDTLRLPAKSRRNRSDAGAALLIAIFALMLVSVVAIALVVSTGTDSSLAGNYRAAGGAYYAALAGLEEARGRLLWKNPNFLNVGGSNAALFDSSGKLPNFGLTSVFYITNPNPATGEVVDPTNLASTNPYRDTEYASEFGIPITSAALYLTTSVSPLGTIPGPSYKWVRINAVTQTALNIDVQNGSGNPPTDNIDLLYYDAAHLNASNQSAPSLVVGPPPSNSDWVQVLEVTALAVLPNGSTRLLQYLVAPLIVSPDVLDLNFPAALTLDNGPSGSVTFNPPNGFVINGVDACSAPPFPQLPNAVASIASTNGTSYNAVSTLISGPSKSDYPGAPLSSPPPNPYTATTPSLLNATAPSPVLLKQGWLTPASLDAAMQDIVNNADIILGPTGTYYTGTPQNFAGQDLFSAAPGMSVSNPMTIVVNGNLTLNAVNVGNPIGYGLLLVTGTLNYHPSAAWNGIVLVVGQGSMVVGGHYGSGGITGSVLVAQTRDSSGNLLANPNMAASYTYGGGPLGAGISYSSCFVRSAAGPLTYKVLSFHEIPQN